MRNVVETELIRFVADAPSSISFADLKRRFCADGSLRPAELKRLIASLVHGRRLCYQSKFGRTVIAVSYDRPMPISAHVLLSPPRVSLAVESGQVAVLIEKGSAFGSGEHPTTRLAVQLIDALLHRPPWAEKKAALRAVDIGTGSGILAIVAAKLGVGRVCAVDTDPCAAFEASANVRLNNVVGRVHVRDRPVGKLAGGADLIFANLRTPTLLTLLDDIGRHAAFPRGLVFSGIKAEESDGVVDAYTEGGYALLETRCEKGWCALCFVSGEFSP